MFAKGLMRDVMFVLVAVVMVLAMAIVVAWSEVPDGHSKARQEVSGDAGSELTTVARRSVVTSMGET